MTAPVPAAASTFRFKPRYRGVAWTAISIGGSLAAVAAALGFVALPLVSGAIGVAAGAAYLVSPTWRLAVTVDDEGLVVGSPKRERFRLAWSEIVRVVAVPPSHACFVDGGAPERSLLVPGDGAPAPYDLENRHRLFELILERVDPARVTTVESLDRAR